MSDIKGTETAGQKQGATMKPEGEGPLVASRDLQRHHARRLAALSELVRALAVESAPEDELMARAVQEEQKALAALKQEFGLANDGTFNAKGTMLIALLKTSQKWDKLNHARALLEDMAATDTKKGILLGIRDNENGQFIALGGAVEMALSGLRLLLLAIVTHLDPPPGSPLAAAVNVEAATWSEANDLGFQSRSVQAR